MSNSRSTPVAKAALRWLWLGGFLIFLAIQIPGVGNIDTALRLQYTRSFWTSEPPARAEAYPEFGIKGRNGVIYPPYSVGQSLLMLPADLVTGALEKVVVRSPNDTARFRSAVVATLTFPALNAFTLVIAFLWLAEIGFTPKESFAGALGLLLGSTFLHYGQVHLENSLEDALLLADALFLWRWLVKPELKSLAFAASTVVAAMLVRLTTLGEHGGLWLVICLAGLFRRDGSMAMRFRQILCVLPIFLAGLAIDRIIHFQRFGQWTGSYISIYGEQRRARDPSLSPDFPFSGDFLTGALGPIISAHRSIFIYDPLLIFLMAIVALHWKRIPKSAKLALIGGAIGFVTLDLFYARYAFWEGANCWANRFTLMPLHLLIALALPLAIRCGIPKRMTILLCVVAFVVQALSISMPAQLEGFPGQSKFTLGQRAVNLTAKLSGKAPPANVPPEVWRINLFPATLGGGDSARAFGLWLCWLGLVLSSAFALRHAAIFTIRDRELSGGVSKTASLLE